MSCKIVVIGGGSGQGNLLRGLKKYTDDLTAIVTVADDGGGSGILRAENGIIPPGDMRKCIMALSNSDPMLERLMKHRFKEGRLKNQSFGNLFILALSEIYNDMDLAVKESMRMLGVEGKVVPVSLDNIHLMAVLSNGESVIGESRIAPKCIEAKEHIESFHLIPKNPVANPEAVDAINKADLIILGPGSLYTSILANLLVPEISDAVVNSKAKKIYICNLMTEYGETDGYTCFDHLNTLIKSIEGINIDYILVNETKIPKNIKEKYKKEGQLQVTINAKQSSKIREHNTVIIRAGFLNISDNGQVIHDCDKVAKIIMDIMECNSQNGYFAL